jgi:DNA polymerase sigma
MQLPSILCQGLFPVEPLIEKQSSTSNNKMNTCSSCSSSSSSLWETYFFEPTTEEQKRQLILFGQLNTATVSELLMDFFKYFGLEFDCSKEVVTVRMGRPLLKQEKISTYGWRLHNRLSIEDPFELNYDVAHVLKETKYKFIRQQFARAYFLLANGGICSIDDTTTTDQIEKNFTIEKQVEQILEVLYETN